MMDTGHCITLGSVLGLVQALALAIMPQSQIQDFEGDGLLAVVVIAEASINMD